MKRIIILIALIISLALPSSGFCWSFPGIPSSGSSGSGDIATDTIWAAAGDTVYGTGNDTAGILSKGTAYQIYMMNSGATAPAWTSTLGATGTRLTAGYFTNIYGTGMTTGIASATAGTLAFLNATNTNAFTITSGVSGAAIGWTLPTAAPGGANYLLNVDADGTMGYTDPSTLGGAAHDAVTLAASASSILGLSTQEVSFDTQTANYVLAGPTTGAAAAPTFRALVSGDIPNNAADTSGNAGTATALAADPADCAAGQIATGIAASGALSCTATPSGLTSVGATTFTGALTGTATGLAGTPNITVGTVNAGAGGMTVDADGDVTAKSVTISKASGVAGDMAVYEANSTDTHGAGFRGPASITGDGAYRILFPDARASSANMVLAVTNGSESGTGTAADPYIQTGSWLDLDNYAKITSTQVLNFGGATLEIPNSDDPDLTVTGQISYDTDGWLRSTSNDGTTQKAIARELEEIHVTVYKPQDLDDAQRDHFWVWSNESGMSFIVTGWKGWSTSDDTTLTIYEEDADGGNDATVDAVELATGSGPYTGSDTTISGATVETGHLLYLDFDDTDAPAMVKMTIYGYYNADVN